MEPQIEAVYLLDLSPRSRDKLIALAQTLSFEEGECIFREGDHALFLYVVSRGEVAIDIHIPTQGTRSIMTASAGELFGWSAMIEPRIETATARAIEPTDVLAIKGGALTDLCQVDHEFGFELYRTLAVTISERLLAARLQMLDMFAAD
jgi:CRP/FNR family transcriptional regulator, cyclic AMP receptor protein